MTQIELGPVAAMFGYGIVTWMIPYPFRTDPGWNLLVRGPANHPEDGVSPLEGLVETEDRTVPRTMFWSTASFTMSWELTRPGAPVRFEAGEPFARSFHSGATSSRRFRRTGSADRRQPTRSRVSTLGARSK